MSQYRLDYVAMHDESGKPVSSAPITIKTYVPALNNPLAYYLFMRRVAADAVSLNVRHSGKLPFSFYVARAKHYGYLYVAVPNGLKNALSFYKQFIVKML